MNTDQYQQAKDAFLQQRDLSPAERSRWLEQHPLDDPVVAAEVHTLLAVHDADQDEPLPEQVGPYRILGRLGEGGMGLVYEAEQPSPRRRVALKVLRPGLAGRHALRRFEQEAEVLGRLHHPGIARIYEAGIDTSLEAPRPWIAMERIHGRSLGEWAQSGPGRRDRIQLLIQIAAAMDHAHTRGIVHRDLKPENVFVDDEGRAKVLDFGIARALDPQQRSATLQTEAGHWLGTLPYTSPEQLGGDPDAIDPRADVYALGVVAYELLLGVLPIPLGTVHPAEAARRILSQEPLPARQVDPGLHRDLEVVLAKALQKDPEQRYGSAAAFAEDLRRHLEHRPILATPASRTQLLAKFCRRHRGLVAGLVVAGLSLIAATAFSLRAANRAIEARDQLQGANRSLEDRSRQLGLEVERLGAVSDFLRQMLTEADPMRGSLGREDARELRLVDLLESASAGLDEAYADRPLIEATLRRTLGLTWRSLHDHAAARRELERALLLLEEADGEKAEILRTRIDLMGIQSLLGPDEVLPAIAELRARCVEEFGAESPERHACDNLRTATLVRLQRWQDAVEAGERAFVASRRDLGEAHQETLVAAHDLACVYREAGRFEEAQRQFDLTLKLKEAAFGPEHPRLLSTRNEQLILSFARGEAEEAAELAEGQIEFATRIFGPDHPTVDVARHQLASIRLAMLQADAAEPVLRQALESVRRRRGEDSSEWQALRYQEARLLCLRGRMAEALPIDEAVLQWRRDRLGEEDPRTLESMNTVGSLLLQVPDLDRAEGLLFELVEKAAMVLPEASDRLARYHISYANSLQRQEAYAEAEEQLLLALDIVEARGERGALAHSVLEQLRMVAEALGNAEESREWRARLGDLREVWSEAERRRP